VMITPSSGYGGAPLAMRIELTVREGCTLRTIPAVGFRQAGRKITSAAEKLHMHQIRPLCCMTAGKQSQLLQ